MTKIKKYIDPFQAIIVAFMVMLCLITLYPFLYVLAYSLSNSIDVMTKTVTIFPVNFTLENFEVVFKNKMIPQAFIISLLRTSIGIVYALCITGLAAYAISNRKLPFNRLITLILIIPMYISGGLIPYYVLMMKLKLFNNFWVYILPHGFWAFNMLIMRTFFDTIPESLKESANIDGASELTILLRIIVPLSKPILATIAMFVGVFQWNSWFDGMLYITDKNLLPLQTLLQKLLLESFSADLQAQASIAKGNKMTSPEALKMATVIVTTIPIVCIYPFFQKHFSKGVMLGAVKA